MDMPCGAADVIAVERPAATEPVSASCPPDEVLIADARAALRPSQFVETKLLSLLRSSAVPVSRLQGTRRRR